MINRTVYHLICAVVRFFLLFYHPILLVKGRENVPKEGRVVICGNHRGMLDPVWIVFALRLNRMPAVIAKKEVFKIPVIGPILRAMKLIPVERDGNDINALKTGMKCLKGDHALLLFPEGTRVKPGKVVEPKGGAVLMAARTDSPILPVYISTKRYPFSPIRCVIGKPYKVEFAGVKPTDAEIQQRTKELMDSIYAMGEQK